jgi:hypothetical protein
VHTCTQDVVHLDADRITLAGRSTQRCIALHKDHALLVLRVHYCQQNGLRRVERTMYTSLDSLRVACGRRNATFLKKGRRLSANSLVPAPAHYSLTSEQRGRRPAAGYQAFTQSRKLHREGLESRADRCNAKSRSHTFQNLHHQGSSRTQHA